ncbi:MAG: type II secretion system protein GspD, partial [Pseudomonadales bacterium]
TTVETDTTEGVAITTFETEVHTVPVGFVMSVTPQISDEETITINARPTISRILGFVEDPNPALADAGTTNLIPEIQVREIESVLKLQNGRTGIIGGLMQNSSVKSSQGLPGLSKIPLLGHLFSYKKNDVDKTELVIFIRPVVVKDPSIEKDLKDYQRYLSSSEPRTAQEELQ